MADQFDQIEYNEQQQLEGDLEGRFQSFNQAALAEQQENAMDEPHGDFSGNSSRMRMQY